LGFGFTKSVKSVSTFLISVLAMPESAITFTFAPTYKLSPAGNFFVTEQLLKNIPVKSNNTSDLWNADKTRRPP
jgi:hypothetical protein